MWWIIIGLVALLVITAIIATTKVWNLQEKVAGLEREQKQSANTTSETLRQKDRLIETFERDLRVLNDHDAALQAKLEAMHLAAMRFCASAKDIYYANEHDPEGWQAKRGYGVQKDSGALWYWNTTKPTSATAEEILSWKPTVDEWIEFANSISAHAEMNKKQWWEKVEERRARQAARRDLNIKFLQNLLSPHRDILSGHGGGLSSVTIDKDQDLRLLQFLEGLRRLIELDHKENPADPWGPQGVEHHLLHKTSFTGALLRRKLMDLVTHHNQEYMAILDRLPSDIAQYFLRQTVAEPVAAAG
ncbi:hypothetical protein A2348_04295 [Candidatus Uhrbacteria bacterium RIFOXYB12_FULL_58_10]|uniref:Uncharacterized protein n=1 Tax=Candidatus Uhrbacteria bacterium RIFOXYB2_FULL_57_15 TaxID=1802422 RepID=A0A1F7W8R3_9BACT|nr:MAG: hypothetical protein A2348_04295 [Candidatus Uhrbacteria bacterium RIFOXYB12_FULL_58_10]OGL98778.1 MAG: hypothetical protein A2304_01205 [Candidatus Uhrbacteria bacterium RIFOXYB2_FULL_57_15]OGL99475.1 MAG: hypothetical protein A2501_04500 [Candidatus Uhrbacteria bacterium RIFOXYC12_FULL_57_11]